MTEIEPVVRVVAYCAECPFHYMESEGPVADEPQCLHPDAEDSIGIYHYEGGPRRHLIGSDSFVAVMPGEMAPPPRCPLRRRAITILLNPTTRLVHGKSHERCEA